MSIMKIGNRRPGLMALLFCFLVIAIAPNPAEAISCSKLNKKIVYHKNQGQGFVREKNYARAEDHFDNLLYYLRKGEKKASGILQFCRFNSREGYNRSYSLAFLMRGFSRYQQGKHSSATKDYQSAVKKNPKNDIARYMLALVYIDTRNKSAAREQYRVLKNKNSPYAVKLDRFFR